MEEGLKYIESLPIWVITTCSVLLLLQLYYLLLVFGRLAFFKGQKHDGEIIEDGDLPPLTVIICAYNEENNLKEHLPSILSQTYPNFEVIVVNDFSTDDTKWVLQDFCKKYRNLRVIDIKEHIQLKHNKKFALTIGIKGAKYDHLVLTDADCQPHSRLWLKEMASGFRNNKEIVLGYSPYVKRWGFLNKLIRFETAQTAINYLSFALKKNAYMGVGRNLAYTKNLFFKGKGFTSHMHIRSGDDDLFVNQNATKENVSVIISPDSFMYSEPKTTWKTYYKQKARHSTASKAYLFKHRFNLGLQLISSLGFYIGLITLVVLSPSSWILILSTYIIKTIIQIIVYNKCYSKLACKDLVKWIVLLDCFYYFFIVINGALNRGKKDISWS